MICWSFCKQIWFYVVKMNLFYNCLRFLHMARGQVHEEINSQQKFLKILDLGILFDQEMVQQIPGQSP